jgi:hypothetical protein
MLADYSIRAIGIRLGMGPKKVGRIIKEIKEITQIIIAQ